MLDWVLRLVAEGHDVTWSMDRSPKTEAIGKGFGLHIVHEWQSHFRWADLVFMTDNVKHLRALDQARDSAPTKAVVAPTAESAAWETDRLLGHKILEKHGIRVPPCKEFKDYDSAIAYVKRQDNAFACKPCGNETDKSLSYVAKSPADLVYMLEKWKKEKKHTKGSFILQEKVKGIEMGVGAWHGPGGFNQGFEINFETKKFLAGDLGPNTGEMGCYSADTDVLTAEGWKPWPEVTEADSFATLLDGSLVYQAPKCVVEYQVTCDMVGWKNRSVDVLVTPNHNMLVASQWSARGGGPDEYKFVQARDCTQAQYAIKRTAQWEGSGPIPMIFAARRGRPEIVVDALSWARFVGVYVAEGWASATQVGIAQSHPEKSQKVGEIINALGVPFTADQGGFRVSSSRIAEHLRLLGRAWEKFVPPYIKDACPAVIEAFLEGYALGDGNMQPHGFRIFYTCSKRLADDVQELLLKIGRLGLIKRRNREGVRSLINGRPIHSRRPAYEVIERPRKLRSWLDARDRYTVPYSGKVYCAEVEGHTLFVRRNGKPMWCGNTTMMMVKRSKLAQKVLTPLLETLERINYVGCIDVNCIIDERGTPWPLEFTMRPGWPAFNIQQALHQGDHAEWLHDLAHGRDARAWRFNEVAIGVVLAIPPFPHPHEKHDEIVGVPVYGIDDGNRENVHPLMMQLGEAPQNINGKVITAPCMMTAGSYVLVATGTGAKVSEAARGAYKVLDQLEVPRSPMWRTDIGKRLQKQLPELERLGYSDGMEY